MQRKLRPFRPSEDRRSPPPCLEVSLKLKSALKISRSTPITPTATITKEELNFILRISKENLIVNDQEVDIIPRRAYVFFNNVEKAVEIQFQTALEPTTTSKNEELTESAESVKMVYEESFELIKMDSSQFMMRNR